MEIKIEDAIWCKADKEATKLIAPCLLYKDKLWRKFKGRRVSKAVNRYMIDRRSGLFLAGLLPKVKQYVRKKEQKITVVGKPERLEVGSNYKIKGITYRPDQEKILRAIARKQRGYIKCPTGSGKTIIAMGISAMFKDCRILFLCHTKELLRQSYEEFLDKGFSRKQVLMRGDGHKTSFQKIREVEKKYGSVILISTIQSFAKFKPEEYHDFWDVTIVDECHHVCEKSSQYGEMLHYNQAPIRIGFTATPPPQNDKLMVMEGLLGGKIGSLSVTEGIELGILAKPEVKLIPVPYNATIAQSNKTYREIYRSAIVESRIRNRLIADSVRKTLANKDSVLIMIREIDHGKEIENVLKLLSIKCSFVHGSTSREDRIRVARRLERKKTLCVICSTIWREGINIKSLNHIINAAGGKDEKGVLQAMGRGLRTAEGKSKVTLTDFLDPYRYLAEHTVARVSIYIKEGLMK